MPGTKQGGIRAAATNKERHGQDFYKKIGTKGGQNGTTGGFAANRELARIAGAKGGRISKRRSDKAIREAKAEEARQVLLADRKAKAEREADTSSSAEAEGNKPGFLQTILRGGKKN